MRPHCAGRASEPHTKQVGEHQQRERERVLTRPATCDCLRLTPGATFFTCGAEAPMAHIASERRAVMLRSLHRLQVCLHLGQARHVLPMLRLGHGARFREPRTEEGLGATLTESLFEQLERPGL